jgi:hypothetical protein
MGRYGLNQYDLAYYGNSDAIPYVSTSFRALPEKYGYIHLSWNSPYGQWSKIKLVRNTYGFPVNAWDGDVLDIKNDNSYVAFKETDPTMYDDKVGLGTNMFYYYSLFIFETVTYTWVRVGNAIALSPKDYGYTDLMYDSLPDVYKVNSLNDPFSNLDNEDLYNFLSLFGFQLSYDHTNTNLLTNRYNVETVSGSLLPTFMQQFGLSYEPEVGLQQSRILLKNITEVLKEKGSKAGLKEYLKSYAGYGINDASTAPNPGVQGFTVGANLMLDYNDSSFEESIGRWASPNSTAVLYCLKEKKVTKLSLTSNVATLTIGAHGYQVGNKVFTKNFSLGLFNSNSSSVTITAISSTTISYALTGTNIITSNAYNNTLNVYPTIFPEPYPYSESTTATSLYPNRQKGIMAVKNSSVTAGTIKVSCGTSNNGNSPIKVGIPVNAGTAYSFSVYSAAGTTLRSITAGIDWYDRFGVYISSSTGTGTNNATGEFSVRLKAENKTAPSGAYYAIPTLSIASAAGSASNEWQYFDCAQFEAASSASAFNDARCINVIFTATRINELINPHFVGSSSAAPWVATGGTSTIATNYIEPEATVFSANYLTLVSGVATLESPLTNDLKVGQTVYVTGVTGITNGAYTVTGWTAATSSTSTSITFNSGGSTTAVRAAVTGSFYKAGNALKVTASSSTVTLNSWDGTTTSQQMGIYYPNIKYTFSIYARGTTSNDASTASIIWYDSSHSVISTENGTSTALTNSSTKWTRVSVSSIAPATAAYATVKVTTSTTSGNIILFDSSLFERTPFVLPFFSGSDGPGPSTDFLWEGAANASRSHQYKNYYNVSVRLLNGSLTDQLLLGTSIAIKYAQPKT